MTIFDDFLYGPLRPKPLDVSKLVEKYRKEMGEDMHYDWTYTTTSYKDTSAYEKNGKITFKTPGANKENLKAVFQGKDILILEWEVDGEKNHQEWHLVGAGEADIEKLVVKDGLTTAFAKKAEKPKLVIE